MEIKRVKGNTFCIDTGMSYIPFYKVNEEEIIMLDSGWAAGEQQGIDDLVEKNKFRVVGIIATHAHMDHIGNNLHFKKKDNSIIAMPANEAYHCSSLVNLKVHHYQHTLSDVIEHYGHLLCEADILISDNQDKVYICGTKFRIIHTPGHSPAHISIITPDNVAYLGDVLISYEVMKGAKMPYGFVLKEDLKSKAKLYDLDCSKYVVAHKGIYDNITSLITDNIDFYKNRAARIYEFIDGVMTLEEIMKVALKEFNLSVNSKYKYAHIESMLRCYVDYLDETGSIELSMVDGLPKYSRSRTEV